MGTRADFYVGRGADAEWLGSVAWDGYPDGLPNDMLRVVTEQAWRTRVAAMLAGRDDATLPEMGWPWPWENSHTTDYAYAFDGQVWGSCFGDEWWPASEDEPSYWDDEKGEEIERAKLPVDAFPDMSDRKSVTFGKRSGVLFVSAPAPEDAA